MTRFSSFDDAYAAIWERSGWDRGFISNPFAGDDAARLGLVRTERVLAQLGHPERALPLVHIAGSKGKGSTTAMIDAMLRAVGVRSGRFMSPHLHSIRERFAIDDALIDESTFGLVAGRVFDAADVVESLNPEIGKLTAWELSTAIALEWFAASSCDIAVVEVGMGGTLDATNVITPIASVITRLDLEHTAVLGNTIAEIASNKAGIIKPGVPVLTVDQPLDGLRMIEERSRLLESALLIAGRDWFVTGSEDDFRAQGPWWDHEHLALTLRGLHQTENAGLAIAAVEVLRKTGKVGAIEASAVRHGLLDANVPGRFEIIACSSEVTVILDGAHTPASMRALADTIRRFYPDRRITGIVGMLSGRDPREVLPILAEIADDIVVTASGNPRSIDPAELEIAFGPIKSAVTSHPDVAAALTAASARANGGVVVVTGSFSVVADARVALGLVDAPRA